MTRRNQRRGLQPLASTPKVVIDLTSDSDEPLPAPRTATGPLLSHTRSLNRSLASSTSPTCEHPCKIEEDDDWSPRSVCRLGTPHKSLPGSDEKTEGISPDDSGVVMIDHGNASTASTSVTEWEMLDDSQENHRYNKVTDGSFGGSHDGMRELRGSRETHGPSETSERKRVRRPSTPSQIQDDCPVEAPSDPFGLENKCPRLDTTYGGRSNHTEDYRKVRDEESRIAVSIPTNSEKPQGRNDRPHSQRCNPRVPFEVDDSDEEEKPKDVAQTRKQVSVPHGRAQSVRIRVPEYKPDEGDGTPEEDVDDEDEDDDPSEGKENDDPGNFSSPPSTVTPTPSASAKTTQHTEGMPSAAPLITKSAAQIQHEERLLEMMRKVREHNKQLLKTKGPVPRKASPRHRIVEKSDKDSLFDRGPEIPRISTSHPTKTSSVESAIVGSTSDTAVRGGTPKPFLEGILRDLHASRRDPSTNQPKKLPPIPKIPLSNGRAAGWGTPISSQRRIRTAPKKSAANASIIKRAKNDLKQRSNIRKTLQKEYHYGSSDKDEEEDEHAKKETLKTKQQEEHIFALLMKEDAQKEQAAAAAEAEKRRAARVEQAKQREFLVSRQLYLEAQRKKGKEPSLRRLEELKAYERRENDTSATNPVRTGLHMGTTAGPCSTNVAKPAPLTSANLAALSAGKSSPSSSQTRAINIRTGNTVQEGAGPLFTPNHQNGVIVPPQAKTAVLGKPEADFDRTNLVSETASGPVSLRELAEKVQAAQQPESLQKPAATDPPAIGPPSQTARQEPRNLAIRQTSINNRAAGQPDQSPRVFDSFYGKPAYQSLSKNLPLISEEEKFLIKLREEEGKEWNEISQMFE
ncbi:hypothetical protein LTS18_006832, partial [Coniosporium uncinatum]